MIYFAKAMQRSVCYEVKSLICRLTMEGYFFLMVTLGLSVGHGQLLDAKLLRELSAATQLSRNWINF